MGIDYAVSYIKPLSLSLSLSPSLSLSLYLFKSPKVFLCEILILCISVKAFFLARLKFYIKPFHGLVLPAPFHSAAAFVFIFMVFSYYKVWYPRQFYAFVGLRGEGSRGGEVGPGFYGFHYDRLLQDTIPPFAKMVARCILIYNLE